MSKKKRQEFADLSLYREMRDIARMEARAIAKRRSADMAKGLSDNEIAQKIREARGTNIPAFSAKGQSEIVASFWKEAKAVRPAILPLPKAQRVVNAKTTSDGKAIDERGSTYDTGWYTPSNGHPGFKRTA